jgi:group I intron endonuclease
MFTIYEIKNKSNDWRYIGCSKDYIERWSEHKRDLNKQKHHNIHLQRAWNKYGEDEFEFNVLLQVESEKTMFLEEARMIEQEDMLYNIFEGGLGGDRFTNHPNKEEYRKKLSDATKKRYKDPKEREKSNVFKDLTPEEREKMIKKWSEASKGSKNGRFKYDKKVKQIDKKSRKVVKIYNYARLVDEDGYNSKYVIHCCNKKEGHLSHKGYLWEWDG